MRARRILNLLFFLSFVSACGGNNGGKFDGEGDEEVDFLEENFDGIMDSEQTDWEDIEYDADGQEAILPPPICSAGTKWQPGISIFEEVTHESLLDVIGALGIRLSAVDFDGDGWTDIVSRLGGTDGDDFSDLPKRKTWLLRNKGDGTFEDVTQTSNIRQMRSSTDSNKGRPGEVFAFADVNNDGFLDVFTGITFNESNPSTETSEIMLNNGDGTFTLGPSDSDLRRGANIGDSVAGASFLDFDRDGCIDLWVVENSIGGNPAQDRLYRGDCTGRFHDETLLHGLGTRPWISVADLNQALGHSWGWASAACDLNNDGWLDLLSSSYGRAPNHLWLAGNSENGFQFTNVSISSGYAFDERMDWTDNESARCWCHLHPADEDCEGVPPPQYIPCATDADAFRWDHQYDREPFRLGGNSATTICADVNNDGWLDLITGEIVHWDVGSSSDPAELLVNLKDSQIKFQRPGNEVTGLERFHSRLDWNEGIMTGAVLDFDNDGWLDLYWGNSDYPGDYGLLYHQDSPGHFEPVSIAEGIDHHRSHGVAIADFDHDGALDVVVGHSFARCSGDNTAESRCYTTQQIRLFKNILGGQGNFIEITLRGTGGSNSSAIGARVTAVAGGITQVREVGGGYGHYGAQNDLTVHFGLGEECEAQVEVIWPDANRTTQNFVLPSGYAFLIVQGEEPRVLWSK